MGLGKRSMGPRSISDVEPERSQDDMALEQLGPLGIPGRRAEARMIRKSRGTRLQSDFDIAKEAIGYSHRRRHTGRWRAPRIDGSS